jgi:hypothetical protein
MIKDDIKDCLLLYFRFFKRNQYPDKKLDFKSNRIIYGTSKESISKSYTIPKKIWTFWSVKSPSYFASFCIERWKALHPDYQVIVINEDNIVEYLPEFDMTLFNHPLLPIQNVSDLIRLSLLENYGGVWLDASVFIEDRIDEIIDIQSNQLDFFGYFDKLGEKRQIPPIVETWFLIAPKGSPFISLWRKELLLCFQSLNPKEHYINRDDFNLLIEGYEDIKDYMLVYVAQQIVLRYYSDHFKIMLFQSEFGPAYVNHKCGWNGVNISRFLLFEKYKNVNLPAVKLMGNARRAIDDYMSKKKFKKDSYIGRFIK